MQLAVARMRNRLLRRKLNEAELDPVALANLSALDHLRNSTPVYAHRFVVVDLETTGLDLARDQVVSLGAVAVIGGEVRMDDIFYELVNPTCAISEESIAVHGILPELVQDARCFEDVFADFLAYLGQDVLIAHHARFDLHFLNQAMNRAHGFDLQNLVLDTELLCREAKVQPAPLPFTPHMPLTGLTLDKLAQDFGVRLGDRHTAIGDARATAHIFLQCLEQNYGGKSCKLGKLLWSAGIF